MHFIDLKKGSPDFEKFLGALKHIKHISSLEAESAKKFAEEGFIFGKNEACQRGEYKEEDNLTTAFLPDVNRGRNNDGDQMYFNGQGFKEEFDVNTFKAFLEKNGFNYPAFEHLISKYDDQLKRTSLFSNLFSSHYDPLFMVVGKSVYAFDQSKDNENCRVTITQTDFQLKKPPTKTIEEPDSIPGSLTIEMEYLPEGIKIHKIVCSNSLVKDFLLGTMQMEHLQERIKLAGLEEKAQAELKEKAQAELKEKAQQFIQATRLVLATMQGTFDQTTLTAVKLKLTALEKNCHDGQYRTIANLQKLKGELAELIYIAGNGKDNNSPFDRFFELNTQSHSRRAEAEKIIDNMLGYIDALLVSDNSASNNKINGENKPVTYKERLREQHPLVKNDTGSQSTHNNDGIKNTIYSAFNNKAPTVVYSQDDFYTRFKFIAGMLFNKNPALNSEKPIVTPYSTNILSSQKTIWQTIKNIFIGGNDPVIEKAKEFLEKALYLREEQVSSSEDNIESKIKNNIKNLIDIPTVKTSLNLALKGKLAVGDLNILDSVLPKNEYQPLDPIKLLLQAINEYVKLTRRGFFEEYGATKSQNQQAVYFKAAYELIIRELTGCLPEFNNQNKPDEIQYVQLLKKSMLAHYEERKNNIGNLPAHPMLPQYNDTGKTRAAFLNTIKSCCMADIKKVNAAIYELFPLDLLGSFGQDLLASALFATKLNSIDGYSSITDAKRDTLAQEINDLKIPTTQLTDKDAEIVALKTKLDEAAAKLNELKLASQLKAETKTLKKAQKTADDVTATNGDSSDDEASVAAPTENLPGNPYSLFQVNDPENDQPEPKVTQTLVSS